MTDSTKFFLKNVTVEVMGLLFILAAALWTKYDFLGPIGGTLLSAAQMSKALDGSFAKHAVVFCLGIACMIVGVNLPAAKAALNPVATALLQSSNFALLMAGMRNIGGGGGGVVTPGAPGGATPSTERRTPVSPTTAVRELIGANNLIVSRPVFPFWPFSRRA